MWIHLWDALSEELIIAKMAQSIDGLDVTDVIGRYIAYARAGLTDAESVAYDARAANVARLKRRLLHICSRLERSCDDEDDEREGC